MPTIDNKIVQMTFDNKQFEQGAKESIKTLEELKKALELDKAVRSLEGIETAANSLDLSHITNAVDEVSNRFTLMGRIGQRVFDEIAGGVVGAAKTVVSTITSMPDAGFAKYESKNKAIQMIKSAVPDKSIEDIERVIADLNYYTDMTSYDFSAMIHNIGKFTSVGVDLETAERAMEGIANVAASAGAEISQANIAMYNFSQAMAAGAMKFVDWKSLNNAGISTKEFKEQAIQAAIELGKLNKTAEYAGTTAKGVAVDFRSFDTTLRYGWLDTDVMIRVLEEYADRTSYVGNKAWQAAREAITFGQAMDAVKDAISTGWMTSYQHVFGNLEEATKLFTGINDEAVKLAERFYLFRNEMLETWHEGKNGISGYSLAVDAFWNIWDSLTSVLYMARDAFEDIFGTAEDLGNALFDATAEFKSFTDALYYYFGFFRDSFEEDDPAEGIAEAAEEYEKFSEVIKRGDRSDEVMRMQTYLMGLGNDLIKLDGYGADGIFGPETQAAVKAFQKAFDLEETGILDENTGNRLIEEYMNRPVKTISDIWDKELKSGDKNEQVQKMQEMLLGLNNDLIKLDGSGADGIFGPETQAAVKEFQKQAGLEPTGIFDKATQDALVNSVSTASEENEEIRRKQDYISAGAAGIKGIFRGIASLAKIIVNVFKLGIGVIGLVGRLLMPVVSGVLAVGGAVGDALAYFASFLDSLESVDIVSDDLREKLEKLKTPFDTIGIILGGVANGISTIVNLARESDSLESIGEKLFELDPEQNAFAYAIYDMLVMIKAVAEEAKPYLKEFGDQIGVILSSVFGWISEKINIAIEKLTAFVTNLFNAMKEGNVVQKILGVLLGIFKGVALAVSAVVAGIFALGKAAWDGAKMLWNLVIKSELLTSIFSKIDKTVGPAKEELDKLFKAFEGFSLKNFATFEEFFDSFVSNLDKSNLTKWLVKPLQKMKGVLTKPAKLFSNVSGSIEKINSMSKKGMGLDAILATLKTNPEQNKTAIGIVNFLVTVRDIIRKIVDYGGALKVTLSTAFTSVWDRLKTFAGNIWDNLRKFFTPNEGESFGEMIAGKIAAVKETIEAKWQEVVDWVTGIIDRSPFLSGVVGGVKSIWDGAVDFFKPAEGETFASNLETNVKNALGLLEKPAKEVINFFTGNDSLMEAYSLMEGDDIGLAEAKRQSGYDKTLPGIVEKIKMKFIIIKNDLEKWWKEFSSDPIVSAGIKFVESVWGNIVEFFTPREGEDLPTYILNRVIEVKTGIRGAVDIVKAFCETIISNPVVQGVFGFFSSVWGNIISFFGPDENGQTFGDRVREVVKTIQLDILVVYAQLLVWWDQFRRSPIGSTIIGWADSIWGGVVDFFVPNDGESFVEHIRSGIQGVMEKIRGLYDELIEFVTGKKSGESLEEAEKKRSENQKRVADLIDEKTGLEDAMANIDDSSMVPGDYINKKRNLEAQIKNAEKDLADSEAVYKKALEEYTNNTLPGAIDAARSENPAVDSVATWLETIWSNIIQFFDPLINGQSVTEFLQMRYAEISGTLTGIASTIGTYFEELKTNNALVGTVIGFAESAWAAVVAFFDPTEEDTDIITYIKNRVEVIKGAISDAIAAIKEFFTGDNAKAEYDQMRDLGVPEEYAKDASGYNKTLPGIVQHLRETSPIIDGILDVAEPVWERLKTFIGNISNAIVDFVTPNEETGQSKLQQLIGNLTNFDGVGDWITNFASTVKGGYDKIKGLFDEITKTKGGIVNFIAESVEDLIGEYEKGGVGKLIDHLWSITSKFLLMYLAIGVVKFVSARKTSLFQNFGEGMEKVGVGLLAAGASVYMISLAFKNFADIMKNGEDSMTGADLGWVTLLLAGLEAFFTAMASLDAVINNGISIDKTGLHISGILTMAISMEVIVDAIGRLINVFKDLPKIKNDKGELVADWNYVNDAVGVMSEMVAIFLGGEFVDALIQIFKSDNSFSSDIFGNITSGTGILAIAMAVSVAVGAMSDLIDIVKDMPIDKTGKRDMRDVHEAVEELLKLVGIFTASDGILTLIEKLDFKHLGNFETNIGGAISGATGVVGIAYAVKVAVDALITLNDAIKEMPKLEDGSIDTNSLDKAIHSIEILVGVFTASSILNNISSFKDTTFSTGVDKLMSGGGLAAMILSISVLVDSLGWALTRIEDVDTEKIKAFGDVITALVGITSLFDAIDTVVSKLTEKANPTDSKVLGAFEKLADGAAAFLGEKGLASIVSNLGDALPKIEKISPEQIEAFGSVIESITTIMRSLLLGSGAEGGLFSLLGGPAAGAISALNEFASGAGFALMAQGIPAMAQGIADALAVLPDHVDTDKIDAFGRILSALAGGLGDVRVEWLENLFGGDSTLSTLAPALEDFAYLLVGGKGYTGLLNILDGFDDADPPLQAMLRVLQTVAAIDVALMSANYQSTSSSNIKTLGSELQQFFADINETDTVGEVVQKTDKMADLADAFAALFTMIGKAVTGNWESITPALDSAVSAVIAYIESRLPDMAPMGERLSENLADGISTYASLSVTAAQSMIDNCYNSMYTITSMFDQIGMYIDFGLAQGLSDYQSASIIQAVAVAKACYDAACHFLGVNSPSKEFAWIGQQLNAGLAQGLYKYAGLASSASTDVASSALDGAKKGLSGYDTSLFDGLDANPVISPVLDLSNISDGASRIGGLIGNRYSVGVSGANLANRINVGSVASVRSGGTSNQDMAAAIDTLSLRMDQLGNAISNMKVVTDTGVLLGVVVPGVDSALGELEYMNSRGI